VFASDLNEVGTLAAVTKQKGATSIFGYKPFPAGGTKQELEFKYEHLGLIKKLAMGFLQMRKAQSMFWSVKAVAFSMKQFPLLHYLYPTFALFL